MMDRMVEEAVEKLSKTTAKKTAALETTDQTAERDEQATEKEKDDMAYTMKNPTNQRDPKDEEDDTFKNATEEDLKRFEAYREETNRKAAEAAQAKWKREDWRKWKALQEQAPKEDPKANANDLHTGDKDGKNESKKQEKDDEWDWSTVGGSEA